MKKNYLLIILLFTFLTNIIAQQRADSICNNCLVKYPLITDRTNFLERPLDSIYIKSTTNHYKLYSIIEEDSIDITLIYDPIHKTADVRAKGSYNSFFGRYFISDSVYKFENQSNPTYYYQKLNKDGLWTFKSSIYCQTETWNKGVRDGIFRIIKHDSIEFGGKYKNGKQIGEWKDESEGGLYKYTYFDASENPIYYKTIIAETAVIIEEIFLIDISDKISYANANWFWIEYYNDGKLKSKGHFRTEKNVDDSWDDIPFGIHKFWDEKGKMTTIKYDKKGKVVQE